MPYWPRADIERGAAPVDGQGARLRRRSGRGVLPADPGLGPRRARRRQRDARRLRRPERPSVPLDRPRADRARRAAARAGVDAGHPRVGRRNPDKLPALLDENPSYVFFREVPPPAPGHARGARSTGRSARSACRCSRERTIAVDPRAIPLGAPVFLATTQPLSTRPLAAPDAGAGHRRRDPRRRARRLLLGLRRRGRAQAGPDAAGRADVAAVAEGRCAADATGRALTRASAPVAAPPSACRSAWYDERTSAPTAACRKPIAYASRSNIANVSGCT